MLALGFQRHDGMGTSMSAVFLDDRWACQILQYKALISEKAHMAERRCSCLRSLMCIVFQHAYPSDPPLLQAKYALPRGGGPAPRTTRIFVARIPPMVSDVEFRQYFERFGQVQVSQHSLFLYQLLVHDSRNPCLSGPSCSCYGISNLSWCKGPFRQSTDPVVLLWPPSADGDCAFAGRLHAEGCIQAVAPWHWLCDICQLRLCGGGHVYAAQPERPGASH